MTPFMLLAALLGALAVALLTRPLWWPARAPADAASPASRPSAGLAALLALFVFGVAAGGYAGIGAPERLAVGPGTGAGANDTASPSGEAADPERAQAAAQVSAMVEQLAERMKARPDDAQGWHMLGRAYAALGQHAQAVDALAKAVRLRPEDATLLVDYAFAMAMAQQRSFAGEPAKLVERALKLEPNNPKALALAGTAAFESKDYPRAVRYWETLAQGQAADGRFAEQIRNSIAQARQLAGMPPAALPVADSVARPPKAAASSTSAAASAGRVSGTVTLAASLTDRVSPDDTLFVFARAVDGPRMPLAILRKQVKDLPLRFTLDDSMAMSPAATLSSASRIIVGARISKSGNAMPQSGDLQGLSAPVAVGASGVAVEVNAEVAR